MLGVIQNKCVHFSNHLLVFCNMTTIDYHSVVQLKIGENKFPFLGLWKTKVPNTCIFIFRVPKNIGSSLVGKNAQLFAIQGGRAILDLNLSVSTIASDSNEDNNQAVLSALHIAIDLPDPISLAVEMITTATASEKYEIDKAFVVDKTLVVTGWIQNAAEYKLHAFSEDFTSYVSPDNFFFHSRADVSKSLQRLGAETRTNRHGFVCTYTLDVKSKYTNYIIAIIKNGSINHLCKFYCTKCPSREETVSALWQLQSAGTVVDIDFVKHALRPLVQEHRTDHKFKVKNFYKSHVNIELSVIVPFFKEHFFIKPLLLMQDHFPETVEWVYVCDDTGTAIEVTKYIHNRSSAICRNTKVVINNENYGYGISNNIGARCSAGNMLLFMNSDIWIENYGAIADAMNHVKSGLCQLIGFRLLFEDGSLQHDGMIFKRSRSYAGLFLAEHRSKGLPPEETSVPFEETIAVTGALMMVDRRAFETVGGFDQSYMKGDFEDADLCFSFREKGMKIGIVHDNGNYHLERQSIRKMAGKNYRSALTSINCLYFNEKWRDQLEKIGC